MEERVKKEKTQGERERERGKKVVGDATREKGSEGGYQEGGRVGREGKGEREELSERVGGES